MRHETHGIGAYSALGTQASTEYAVHLQPLFILLQPAFSLVFGSAAISGQVKLGLSLGSNDQLQIENTEHQGLLRL